MEQLERDIFVHNMTRKEFREAVDRGVLKLVIIPTGSCEQHREHLALIHDTASAYHIARMVASRLRPWVKVTPPIPFGYSEYWMGPEFRGGTITLRFEHFAAVVSDVLSSLRRHGVRMMMVLNGHGGNGMVVPGPFLEQLQRSLDAKIIFLSYWDVLKENPLAKLMEKGSIPGHAGEFETSVGLYLFPENVRPNEVDEEEARLATREKGERLVEAIVDGLVNRIRAELGL
ncbi:MAG: creatininase family protein [Candidatus Bathyarchaeia archaeon]